MTDEEIERMEKWWRWTIMGVIFILGFFVGKIVQASEPLTPAQANELSFHDCFDEKSIDINYQDTNMAILTIICEMGFVLQRPVIITSNHRPNSTGQHKFSNAYDFYFSYEGVIGDCAVWEKYIEDADFIKEWILTMGWDDDAGLGIYSNLTHHLDLRNRRARWGRLPSGDYVSYDMGRDYWVNKVEDNCE